MKNLKKLVMAVLLSFPLMAFSQAAGYFPPLANNYSGWVLFNATNGPVFCNMIGAVQDGSTIHSLTLSNNGVMFTFENSGKLSYTNVVTGAHITFETNGIIRNPQGLTVTNSTYTGIDWTSGGPSSGFGLNGVLDAENGGVFLGTIVRRDNSQPLLSTTNGNHFFGLSDYSSLSTNSITAIITALSTASYLLINPATLHSSTGLDFVLTNGYYTNLSLGFSITPISTNWVENFGLSFGTNSIGSPYGAYFSGGNLFDTTTATSFISPTNLVTASITNGLAPLNQVTTQYRSGINKAFSTSYANAMNGPYWKNNQPQGVISVIYANGVYIVNTESNQSFIANAFPIPSNATNVGISFTAFTTVMSGTLLEDWTTNAGANGSDVQKMLSLTTTPTVFSNNFIPNTNADGCLRLYPNSAPFVYAISNIQYTFSPAPTDPVLSQPFAQYDVLKINQHNSAWRGDRPFNTTEGSQITFDTDGSTFDLRLVGSSGHLNLSASVYTNEVFAGFITNNAYSGNFGIFTKDVNFSVPWFGKKTIVFNTSYAIENTATPAIALNPAVSGYQCVTVESVIVPITNTVSLREYPAEQPTLFSINDSILGSGGGFDNNFGNSVYPTVQNVTGWNIIMFGAGFWSLQYNFINAQSNFWETVRLSKADAALINLSYNDYGNSVESASAFQPQYDYLLRGLHFYHPSWRIIALGTTTNANEAVSNTQGMTPNNFRVAISNACAPYPFVKFFQPTISTGDLTSDGVHPSPSGNIKLAMQIATYLNTPTSPDTTFPYFGTFTGNGGGLTNIVLNGPTNGTAPGNTTTPIAWANFTNSSGGTFKMPLYQ